MSSLCPGSNARDAEPQHLGAAVRPRGPLCNSQGAETGKVAHQTAEPRSIQAQCWCVILSAPFGNERAPDRGAHAAAMFP
ncbi:hypothetical protein NDU88_005999 [Pleurodeles waltl]|uniref:Uncharacterized protein n=1 Tax=Pleurodeles waltl TaxID=8319 RepID=A0AAV7LPH1_PLEWA|nr:hypothetical protein NDU88_005999 [Pleurodeles waltl]